MDSPQPPDDVYRPAADRLIDDINDRLAEKGPITVESAYERNLHKLTDEQLTKQALELKAKVDAHMKEMARRFAEQTGRRNDGVAGDTGQCGHGNDS